MANLHKCFLLAKCFLYLSGVVFTAFTMTTRSSLLVVAVQIPYFHTDVLASWSNNYILKCYMTDICLLVIMSFSYFPLIFLATLFTDAWNPFLCLYRLHYFLNWPIFSFLFTSICLLTEAFSPFLYFLKYWLCKLSKYWVPIFLLLCFLLVPHVVSFSFFGFIIFPLFPRLLDWSFYLYPFGSYLRNHICLYQNLMLINTVTLLNNKALPNILIPNTPQNYFLKCQTLSLWFLTTHLWIKDFQLSINIKCIKRGRLQEPKPSSYCSQQ